MRILFFVTFLLVSAKLYADGPLYRNKETFTQQEFDNVYQDLRGVRNSAFTVPVSSGLSFGTYPGPTLSYSLATSGSLASATYYYKIFPITKSNMTDFPSVEQRILVDGANKSVTLSWTASPTAIRYRVARGTAQGGGNGYWETTGLTFTDSGQAFDSVAAINTGLNNNWLYVPGVIYTVSSLGGLAAIDYTDNQVHGRLAWTSAGEFEVSVGSGSNQVIMFENSNFVGRVTMGLDPEPYIQFNNSSGNLGRGGIEANPFVLSMNGIHKFDVYPSSMIVQVPLYAAGTTTGDNAPVGFIGETFSTATAGQTLFGATTQFGDLLSTTVAAGDYILSGSIGVRTQTSTTTAYAIGISTTAGNTTGGLVDGYNRFTVALGGGQVSNGLAMSALPNMPVQVPFYRYSTSIPITFYLKYQANYTVGTPTAVGSLNVQRIR